MKVSRNPNRYAVRERLEMASGEGRGAKGREGGRREESGSDNETKGGRDGDDITRGKGEERNGTGESQTGEPPVTPPPSFHRQGGGERGRQSHRGLLEREDVVVGGGWAGRGRGENRDGVMLEDD